MSSLEVIKITGPVSGLRIADMGGFQSRHAATLRLIYETFDRYRPQFEGLEYDFLVYTGDNPEAIVPCIDKKTQVLTYSTTKNCPPNIHAIPDFLFTGWPEIGIDDYETFAANLRAEGLRKPKHDKLFWNGTIQHADRVKLLQVGKENPDDLDIVLLEWKLDPSDPTGQKLLRFPNITLADHADYSFLVDARGQGYSARLKLLMQLGRPVFIIDHDFREFFFDKMRPYKEFIPVSRVMVELPELVRELKKHPAMVRQLGDLTRQFAMTYLTRDYAMQYLRDVLLKIGARE